MIAATRSMRFRPVVNAARVIKPTVSLACSGSVPITCPICPDCTAAADLAEFHLKLIAAAAAGLADPLAIVDAQRRELLRRLRDAQRAAMAEPARSAAGLLLEGIVLRLQADLRWLEACERTWTRRKDEA